MKYLFETHAHTSQASPCSYVDASNLVKTYHDNGYQGIIITDHVGDWGFSNIRGTWEDKMDNLARAYNIAKDMGDKLGIKVFFGMEIALNNPYRDYLVYGLDVDIVYKNKNINNFTLKQLYKTTQKEKALLIAAHPFRGINTKEPPKADFLDGVEVFNGNPRQINNNDKALKFAKKNNLIKLSGSDYHQSGDISGGLILPTCPDTIEEFNQMLLKGDYEMIP